MALKKLLVAISIFVAANFVIANENEQTSESDDKLNQCEIIYSKCMDVCDSNVEKNFDVEYCYNNCDNLYSECLKQSELAD